MIFFKFSLYFFFFLIRSLFYVSSLYVSSPYVHLLSHAYIFSLMFLLFVFFFFLLNSFFESHKPVLKNISLLQLFIPFCKALFFYLLFCSVFFRLVLKMLFFRTRKNWSFFLQEKHLPSKNLFSEFCYLIFFWKNRFLSSLFHLFWCGKTCKKIWFFGLLVKSFSFFFIWKRKQLLHKNSFCNKTILSRSHFVVISSCFEKYHDVHLYQ